MNEDSQISGAVSALVMLAAIASTYNVYSFYKDDQLATQYEEVQSSLDSTASAFLSLRMQKAATEPLSTTTSITDKSKIKVEAQ